MKKCLITLVVFFSVISSAFAQRGYSGGENALGARLGGGTGVTFKHFSSTTRALEFVGGWGLYDAEHEGMYLSALFEKHAPMAGNKLAALFGVGPTVLFGNKTTWGATGSLGFDWRLAKTPVNLQIDWMPAWYFINDGYMNLTNAAVSVRYILNHKALHGRK